MEDFENDVRSIANILDKTEWDALKNAVNKLWLGESTWREFVEYLMQEWYLAKDHCTSLDKKGIYLLHMSSYLHLTLNDPP